MIRARGYDGTVDSLRMFMQKEHTHRKSISSMSSEPKEYIPRKFMCQLIYRELEKVRGITQEQYYCAIKLYPMLGQLYSLLKDFHRIIFSQKSNELDERLIKSSKLNIDEINIYVSRLKAI